MSHIEGVGGSFEFVTKCDRGGWASKNAKISVVSYVNGPLVLVREVLLSTAVRI